MEAITDHLDIYTHLLDHTAEKAQQLEGAKTIASLARYGYATTNLAKKTVNLQIITENLNLLHINLLEEAENYQEQYHAAPPGIFLHVMKRCIELKDSLLDSSTATIKKMLRSKTAPPQGITMHPAYPDSVFTYCERMLQARHYLALILLLCRNIIHEENDIRLSPSRCKQIFNDSYWRIVKENQPFIKLILTTHAQLDPDVSPQAYELACRMKEARNWEEAICQCFHAYDSNAFKLFVVHRHANEIRQKQNLDHELWADNDEMTRKTIYVLENFDRLGTEVLGKRLKTGSNQHAIKAKAVLMLYNWCAHRGCQCSESRFVSFFQKHYRGAHKPPTLSSVNSQKNRSRPTQKENEAFAKKVDKIIKEMPPIQTDTVFIN